MHNVLTKAWPPCQIIPLGKIPKFKITRSKGMNMHEHLVYRAKLSARKVVSFTFAQPTEDFNFYSLYQTLNCFPPELWYAGPEEKYSIREWH